MSVDEMGSSFGRGAEGISDEEVLKAALKTNRPHTFISNSCRGCLNAQELHYVLICSRLFVTERGRHHYWKPYLLVDGLKGYTAHSEDVKSMFANDLSFRHALVAAINKFGADKLPAHFVKALGSDEVGLKKFAHEMGRDPHGYTSFRC